MTEKLMTEWQQGTLDRIIKQTVRGLQTLTSLDTEMLGDQAQIVIYYGLIGSSILNQHAKIVRIGPKGAIKSEKELY